MNWTEYLPTLLPLVVAAAVAVGGYLLSHRAAEWLRLRGSPPPSVRGVRVTISVIAFAVAAAILFLAFGRIGAVSGLTFSALIGLAATLALQNAIGNVIAGFILLRSRVLRLNDNIQIGGMSGKVVRVGLVTTWLRIEDGSLASVSNSTLLSGPLQNRNAGERLKGEY